MVVTKEGILDLLRQKGPLVPNEIKKSLGGDTMLLGAMLSELAGRRLINITDVKLGSSPFYYLPNQLSQLERLQSHLNSKDQQTAQLLQSKKVLADKSMELLERVSLRKIKDYAKELQVQTSNGLMLFWRYYLVSEQEAIQLLKERYNPKPKEESSSVHKTNEQDLSSKADILATTSLQESKSSQQESQITLPQKESLIQQNSVVDVVVDKVAQSSNSQLDAPVKTTHMVHKQQTMLEQSSALESSPFLDELLAFFSKKQIKIQKQEQLGKNREYVFELLVPSSVGNVLMYAVARNKKKLTQQDVAPALLQAKMKNLSCMFMYNGEFSKKSLDIIEKEYTGLLLVSLV